MEEYKEEFKDLQKVYAASLDEIVDQVVQLMPAFIGIMKKYIELHEQGTEFNRKLLALREKLGLNDEDEGDDE